MGKKDIQQGEDGNQGCCRRCLGFLQCCHLPASSGVKIVSIVSIVSFRLHFLNTERTDKKLVSKKLSFVFASVDRPGIQLLRSLGHHCDNKQQ